MEYDQEILEARKSTPNRARVWTVEEISRLIKLWSQHEVLYNTRHPDYYKREKRSVAMNEIHEELGGINLVDIIRKMENLRSYFGREIKKLYDTGIPIGETEGRSRWAYYNSLLFLEEHMNQKKATPRSDEARYDSIARLDDTITSREPHGGDHGDVSVDSLEDENKIVYHSEPAEATVVRQIKRPRLNDRCKQDVSITRVQIAKPPYLAPTQPPVIEVSDPVSLGQSRRQTRDAMDTYIYPKESKTVTPQERPINELHEDMIFAEHVGRTIMSITNELLKEDLKLQIQQCLCSTKRKQIALQQQQQQQQDQQKHNNSQNTAHNWQRSDKIDSQQPTFVSFVSVDSPGSPIHPVPPQIDKSDQNHNS